VAASRAAGTNAAVEPLRSAEKPELRFLEPATRALNFYLLMIRRDLAAFQLQEAP
jgi:hypothetical protein